MPLSQPIRWKIKTNHDFDAHSVRSGGHIGVIIKSFLGCRVCCHLSRRVCSKFENSSPEALGVVREGGETLSNTRGNSEVNLEQTVFDYNILTTSPPRGAVPYTNVHFLSS